MVKTNISYVTKILEKKLFNSGVTIPTKTKFSKECTDKKI